VTEVKPLDILLVNIPRQDFYAPPAGIAQIKSAVEAAGFQAKCIDLNIDLYRRLEEQGKLDQMPLWADWALTNAQLELLREIYGPILDDWAALIASHNPTYLGISIFSNISVIDAKALIKRVRVLLPYVKIVVGGPGVKLNGQALLEGGYCDFYIAGEGELAIQALLRGENSFPGINSYAAEIPFLDRLPFPDYSDFNFSSYRSQSPSLVITGSRGCVRNCTFCNVRSTWKAFRFRTGKSLAAEMLHQHERHGTTNFNFSDNLVNGALHPFRDFCRELVEIRRSRDIAFRWSGHFIIRSKAAMPPSDFELMRDAGADTFWVGIESGSEAVRAHMKKMFSDADMDYTFEQCQRNGLRLQPMLFFGYPTETEADFRQTLDWIQRNRRYSESKTIVRLLIGATMSIEPGSPVDERREELKIRVDEQGQWYSELFPENTMDVRIERHRRALELAQSLNYPLIDRHSKSLSRVRDNILAHKIPAPENTDAAPQAGLVYRRSL